MVATANPMADFHCQVITHAGRTRYPRPYRRGTFKTQAVLVLFLLLPGIWRICESLLRWFPLLRRNILFPKCSSCLGRPFEEMRIFVLVIYWYWILFLILSTTPNGANLGDQYIKMNMIKVYANFQIFPVRIISSNLQKLYSKIVFYTF